METWTRGWRAEWFRSQTSASAQQIKISAAEQFTENSEEMILKLD